MSAPAKILVIDDDQGMCETLGDVLQAKGYTVETAACAREGLERLRARHFDAAIVDIKLPDSSGLDLLQAIKETSPDVEVIFITGHASLPTATQAVNGDAFAYLVKPFEMDHLLATLDKALEKQRLARALRESEERYRLITENINDAIFLFDLQGHLVFSNPRGAEIARYPLEELQGLPLSSLLTSESAQQAYARLEAVQTGQEVPPFFEAEVIRKDCSRVWVEANLTSVVKDGRVVGRLGVMRDITERKRLQEQLVQAEKVAAMGQLLAGVAHELNNPLTVVLAQADLLRERLEGVALGTRAETIAHAARRCARIVKNFLTLARQRPPERQHVSLNNVVQEAVELLAYLLRVDNVKVALDLAPDLPRLWADPHQLHQIVVNLVTNAHHAMRATPPPRRLTLATRFDPAGRRVSLAVADTGPGIPPEIQSRIFEPFFTTRPPGEGTGLGLSLCLGVIESHGGEIRVESQPGQGATFVVELPVQTPPELDREDETAEPLPPIRNKRILVVDDEPDVARVLEDVLSADGHQVEMAENGAVALDKLRAGTYDLILSDLRMPKLDGPGLYQEVERRHPEILGRFIFLTGDTLGRETTGFLERTGAPSLSKPFSPEEVRRLIQRALRTQGADSQASSPF